MLTTIAMAIMSKKSNQFVLQCTKRAMLPFLSGLVAVLFVSGCSWREDKATYYPNGQVRIRWQEKMIGPYRIVKDGKYEAFYPTGAKLASGEFRNGDTLGLWEEWYLYGGKRCERTYGELGRPRGRTVVWMPNGDTLDIRTYNDVGELDGRFVSFWPDIGEMHRQGEYLNGKPHGVWQSWYRNGRLEHVREYDRGRHVGVWTECGPDGSVASRREYLRELPAELSGVWGTAIVQGVPVGVSLDFQRHGRRVDTIPSEERVYGDLRKSGEDWIVPFKWTSPRFESLYKSRFDTLIVWKHATHNSGK
jgi:antitoxin component YwqK of YwqJK toxin-antitoxin module